MERNLVLFGKKMAGSISPWVQFIRLYHENYIYVECPVETTFHRDKEGIFMRLPPHSRTIMTIFCTVEQGKIIVLRNLLARYKLFLDNIYTLRSCQTGKKINGGKFINLTDEKLVQHLISWIQILEGNGLAVVYPNHDLLINYL